MLTQLHLSVSQHKTSHHSHASLQKSEGIEDVPLNDYTMKNQARFEQGQGIQFPVVATFDITSRKLHYFAVRHGVGENHPTLLGVKSLIEQLNPDCLILEGFDNSPNSIQSIAEYVRGEMDFNSISENMYAAYLAQKCGILFMSGEPSGQEIEAKLSSQYTEEDFIFYRFLKSIPWYVRGGKNFNSILDYLKLSWLRNACDGQEKRFNDGCIKRMSKVPKLKDLKDTEFAAPIRTGNFIERMSQDIDDIRNWNILNTVNIALKSCSNVLVIYGCSHYFQQFNVLEKNYGLPNYDPPAASISGHCNLM